MAAVSRAVPLDYWQHISVDLLVTVNETTGIFIEGKHKLLCDVFIFGKEIMLLLTQNYQLPHQTVWDISLSPRWRGSTDSAGKLTVSEMSLPTSPHCVSTRKIDVNNTYSFLHAKTSRIQNVCSTRQIQILAHRLSYIHVYMYYRQYYFFCLYTQYTWFIANILLATICFCPNRYNFMSYITLLLRLLYFIVFVEIKINFLNSSL
jgi:hypothetical protein